MDPKTEKQKTKRTKVLRANLQKETENRGCPQSHLTDTESTAEPSSVVHPSPVAAVFVSVSAVRCRFCAPPLSVDMTFHWDGGYAYKVDWGRNPPKVRLSPFRRVFEVSPCRNPHHFIITMTSVEFCVWWCRIPAAAPPPPRPGCRLPASLKTVHQVFRGRMLAPQRFHGHCTRTIRCASLSRLQ